MIYFLIFLFILVLFLLYSILPTIIIRTSGRGILKNLNLDGIALTFDDGPHPKYTIRLLDLLKKYDVKATFFVVGSNAEKNPEVMNRMYQEGHTIGIHHYNHISSWILSPFQLKKQLKQTEMAIKKYTNSDVAFYRPPWGHFNLFTLLAGRKYKIIMWSGIFQDWKVESCKNLLQRLRATSENGTIFLLHDNGETLGADQKAPECMLDNLEIFLEEKHKKGVRFITLNEVL